MQDLSNLAKGSLTAGSMAATNTVSDNSAAHTAPGGESESVQQEKVTKPVLDDITHTRTVLHPEAPPVNGNPFPKGTGPRWVRSGNTETGGFNDYGN
jgi:hypothetical protein